MTDWELDSGHLEISDVKKIYEGRASLDDLISEKLGHAIPQCPDCALTIARAMLAFDKARGDTSANTRLLETLRDASRLGPERLEQWMAEEADELLAVEPRERRALLDSAKERFRLPMLVDELVARCEQQVTKDADRALELAELAVEVSLHVDPAVFHSLTYHARARAEAHRANCLRLHDDVHGASDAFQQARRLFLEAKKPEPEIQAELQRLEASLAIDQRRFDEAEELLENALSLYRQVDAVRPQALTLLKRAHAAHQQGESARGLHDLQEAAALLDFGQEPQLSWTLRYSEVLYAVEAGLAEEARRHYHEHEALLDSRLEPWWRLRVVWLRAKLARSEGDDADARKLYLQARDGFLDQDMGYDAALVSLELALLYVEKGEASAVRHLAAEMLPVFRAQDVHREALAALALFQQAARTESLSTGFIRRLYRYLQLARRDPTLKLEDLSD